LSVFPSVGKPQKKWRGITERVAGDGRNLQACEARTMKTQLNETGQYFGHLIYYGDYDEKNYSFGLALS
jgi:hypothetical protein